MRRLMALMSFDGRLSRLGYWRDYLFLAVVGAASWCLGLLAIMGLGGVGAVVMLPLIPVMIASLAIIVRRLHDRGRSWWWIIPFWILPTMVAFGRSAHIVGPQPAITALVSLVSFVFSIWGLIEIGFRRGASADNRYGEAPRAAG